VVTAQEGQLKTLRGKLAKKGEKKREDFPRESPNKFPQPQFPGNSGHLGKKFGRKTYGKSGPKILQRGPQKILFGIIAQFWATSLGPELPF